MSKKLLNEAAVRRFMGLAGMEANVVSNTVNEMYAKEEEEPMEEKMGHEEKDEAGHLEEMEKEEGHGEEHEGYKMEGEMDAMEGEHEDPVGDEMMGEEAPELEITPEMRDVFIEFGDMLKAKRDAGDLDDEEELDAEEEIELADDDAVEAEEDAEDAAAMMEEEMNEDEIVQEVARRVAARILKAKKAQKEMNEALGK